jgi:hypothetical protein
MTEQTKDLSSMKKAGVGLDDWKLPIFKKHLDAAGYKYEEPVPFTDGTLILRVYYEWVHELQPIIEAAQRECAEHRKTA